MSLEKLCQKYRAKSLLSPTRISFHFFFSFLEGRRVLFRRLLKIDSAICCEWSISADENSGKEIKPGQYQGGIRCKLAFSLPFHSSSASHSQYRIAIVIKLTRHRRCRIVVFLPCILSDGEERQVIRVPSSGPKFRGIEPDPSMQFSVEVALYHREEGVVW